MIILSPYLIAHNFSLSDNCLFSASSMPNPYLLHLSISECVPPHLNLYSSLLFSGFFPSVSLSYLASLPPAKTWQPGPILLLCLSVFPMSLSPSDYIFPLLFHVSASPLHHFPLLLHIFSHLSLALSSKSQSPSFLDGLEGRRVGEVGLLLLGAH